jgi:predicted N-acetyltransferase YhbS
VDGFTLRTMGAGDGPAIDTLMRNEAQTTRFSISTEYLEDIIAALLAQHPTIFGVVAEAPTHEGLVGVATAFTDEVQLGEAKLPTAHLENLKVRHDMRRRGLGSALAAWRIEEAERRFGRDGVIMAGVERSNVGSLATAAHWATHVLGPVRVIIARPRSKPPNGTDLVVRPLEDKDVEAVVDGTNAFYRRHLLFPRLTAESLAAALATTTFGWPIRTYRVAATHAGQVVAGAGISERYRLMVDHIERMPGPLAVVGRLTGQLPADRVLRTIELSGFWHAPGQEAAARHLWDAIRHEWRDRVTNIAAQVDPRSPLVDLLRTGPSLAPRIEIHVPVRSPVPVDERAPVYLWR